MGFVLHGPESVFFKQLPPSPELEPWAERLWVTTPGSPAERPEVRVAPDARTELILRVVSGGVSAAVGGAMSRHRAVPNDGRSIHVGLTLRAHAAAPLFHLNAAELTNETPELAAVAARACRSHPPPDPFADECIPVAMIRFVSAAQPQHVARVPLGGQNQPAAAEPRRFEKRCRGPG